MVNMANGTKNARAGPLGPKGARGSTRAQAKAPAAPQRSGRSRGGQSQKALAAAERALRSQKPLSRSKKIDQAQLSRTIANMKAYSVSFEDAPKTDVLLQEMFRKITLAGLDDPESSPIIPAFADLGDENFFETCHHKTIVYDPYPVLALLGTAGTPTTGAATRTPVYPAGSVPIVSVHDALTMAIFPVVPSADRVWLSDWTAYENGVRLSNTLNPYPWSQMLMGNWAVTAAGMPSGLDYRPITVSVSKSEHQTYIWIDACESKPCLIDLRARGTFTPDVAGMVFTLGVVIEKFCMTDQPVECLRDWATFAGMTGAFDVTTAASKPIYESGYYSIRCCAETGATNAGLLSGALVTLTMTENSTLATAHLLNLYHHQAQILTKKFWLAGSGLLVSPRFPLLTVQGSILGAQLDPAYNIWYQGTIDGESAVYARPIDKIYGAEGGGKLSDGVWVFGCPAQYTSIQDLNSVDDTAQGGLVSQGNFRPLSYLLPSDGQGPNAVGMKLILLNANASAEMRFTGTRIIEYTAESQIVRGSHLPYFPLEDWAALLVALRRLPPMTTNDWHSFLAAVSKTAGKFAAYLKRVTEGVGKVTPLLLTGATLATQIAELAI